MLSHSSKYTLKALHYLSQESTKKEKLNAEQLARFTKVPQPYLSKLFKKLSAVGMVSSVRGPKGGFYLSEKQKEQSIFDIILYLEGEDHFENCILDFEACNAKKPCPIHYLINQEKEALRNTIKKLKISDLSTDLTYLK